MNAKKLRYPASGSPARNLSFRLPFERISDPQIPLTRQKLVVGTNSNPAEFSCGYSLRIFAPAPAPSHPPPPISQSDPSLAAPYGRAHREHSTPAATRTRHSYPPAPAPSASSATPALRPPRSAHSATDPAMTSLEDRAHAASA